MRNEVIFRLDPSDLVLNASSNHRTKMFGFSARFLVISHPCSCWTVCACDWNGFINIETCCISADVVVTPYSILFFFFGYAVVWHFCLRVLFNKAIKRQTKACYLWNYFKFFFVRFASYLVVICIKKRKIDIARQVKWGLQNEKFDWFFIAVKLIGRSLFSLRLFYFRRFAFV